MAFSSFNFYLETENWEYKLVERNNFIGRNRVICAIQLKERFVGRTHTNIVVNRNRCFIQVSAQHQIILNGRKVEVFAEGATAKIDLIENDIIQIYDHYFKLKMIIPTNTDNEDTDNEWSSFVICEFRLKFGVSSFKPLSIILEPDELLKHFGKFLFSC